MRYHQLHTRKSNDPNQLTVVLTDPLGGDGKDSLDLVDTTASAGNEIITFSSIPTDTTWIKRVSVASDGTEGNYVDGNGAWLSFHPISADGRFVVFTSKSTNLVARDTNGVQDIFVYDRVTQNTERVSVANDGTQGDWHSFGASISADGRYIAFVSGASNLVPDDPTTAVGNFLSTTAILIQSSSFLIRSEGNLLMYKTPL